MLLNIKLALGTKYTSFSHVYSGGEAATNFRQMKRFVFWFGSIKAKAIIEADVRFFYQSRSFAWFSNIGS